MSSADSEAEVWEEENRVSVESVEDFDSTDGRTLHCQLIMVEEHNEALVAAIRHNGRDTVQKTEHKLLSRSRDGTPRSSECNTPFSTPPASPRRCPRRVKRCLQVFFYILYSR